MMRLWAIGAFLFAGGLSEAAAQAPTSSAIPATEQFRPAVEPRQATVSPPSPPQAQAPPEEEGSSLDARARALIARSDAGEFFLPGDAPNRVSVRHRPSGLLCALDPHARLGLIVYPPASPNAARGEDVSCNAISASGALAISATRVPEEVSLAEAFDAASSVFHAAHPDAQPYTPQVRLDTSDRPSLPPSRTAAFLVRGAAGMNFTSLWVAKVNGWIIKMRFTGPQGMASELSSNLAWTTALSSVARANRAR